MFIRSTVLAISTLFSFLTFSLGLHAETEPAAFKGMTYAHNQIRSKLGIPALQWSNKLAKHAQEWADYLAENNQCRMKHRPDDGLHQRIYGENIFWASPRRWTNGTVEAQSLESADVVTAWADEVLHYNYANNNCAPGRMCGHYTQIIWKDSRLLGCGMRVCDSLAQLWVCSYDPPGNYIGQRPY